MRVCGIDFETTGISSEADRIIEVGACLFDWETKIPLCLYSSLVNPGKSITEEITNLTGITNEHISEFGVSEVSAIEKLNDIISTADYALAHNAPFDKGFFDASIERNHIISSHEVPWLDSLMDIVYPKDVSTRKLNYLASEAGFVNPWKHRALFDVMTMLKITSAYNLDDIIARSKEPIVYVQALVSFNDKELAKARGYHWYAPSKIWWREFKQSDYEIDKLECDFPTRLLTKALE